MFTTNFNFTITDTGKFCWGLTISGDYISGSTYHFEPHGWIDWTCHKSDWFSGNIVEV